MGSHRRFLVLIQCAALHIWTHNGFLNLFIKQSSQLKSLCKHGFKNIIFFIVTVGCKLYSLHKVNRWNNWKSLMCSSKTFMIFIIISYLCSFCQWCKRSNCELSFSDLNILLVCRVFRSVQFISKSKRLCSGNSGVLCSIEIQIAHLFRKLVLEFLTFM